jgi:hypothetical protein
MVCNYFILFLGCVACDPLEKLKICFSSQHLQDVFHVGCTMTLGEPRSEDSEFVTVFEIHTVLTITLLSPPPPLFFFSISLGV